MKTFINIAVAILGTAFIILLAMWLVPTTQESLPPTVVFRYTTSIPELSHMIKPGDLLIDSMGNAYMKVASVSVKSMNTAVVDPSGKIAIVPNPQKWEIIFKAIPIGEGIVPKFIIGGSLYIRSPRWRKLVRVINMEATP